MRFIDFFAGIGGFRRGMELAGHNCVGFCEYDKYAVASYTAMHLLTEDQRKKILEIPAPLNKNGIQNFRKRIEEILKEEYRNGEWYANDIRAISAKDLPKAECWCFGGPCQDFSVSGKRAGMDGERSSLVREIFRLLEEQECESRPEWIIYENVKGMLSSNKGLDYLSILSEMDRLGYDIEWQNINSAWFVPQNRERIYTVGHLRSFSPKKVFPIEGSSGENRVSIIGHRDGYRRCTQVFTQEGITEILSTAQGGGREHHVAIPCFFDMNYGAEIKLTRKARVIERRYYKGVCRRSEETSGVAIYTGSEKEQTGSEKEQTENGIFVELPGGYSVYAVWYEKYQYYIAIRKLTPKECFRLQGWEDEYFDRAAMVNSDSQLYKQAGNGVTVPVVQAIAERI